MMKENSTSHAGGVFSFLASAEPSKVYWLSPVSGDTCTAQPCGWGGTTSSVTNFYPFLA